MLKGIPKILSPELLKVLAEMGHSDRLVISDGNFPAEWGRSGTDSPAKRCGQPGTVQPHGGISALGGGGAAEGKQGGYGYETFGTVQRRFGAEGIRDGPGDRPGPGDRYGDRDSVQEEQEQSCPGWRAGSW